MATARKPASIRLQALQAEAIAERAQTATKPLASYFSAPGKPAKRPRATGKAKV